MTDLTELPDHSPCWEHTHRLRAMIRNKELAPDSVGIPAPPLRKPDRERLSESGNSRLWLPAGLHAGMHIEHDHRVLTGPFVGPSNWKMVWHITVSSWWAVDAMRDVLHTKSAEVHFVLGGRRGTKLPVLIQCLPLNHFGKGLVHLSGRPETNRSHVLQCEICAQPGDMKNFDHYRVLANLMWLLTHGDNPRVPIPRRLTADMNSPTRHSDAGWQEVEGHSGHDKVPQNTHFDPTLDFEDTKLMSLIAEAPHDL